MRVLAWRRLKPIGGIAAAIPRPSLELLAHRALSPATSSSFAKRTQLMLAALAGALRSLLLSTPARDLPTLAAVIAGPRDAL
jgi:hypothetical protein